MNDGGMEIALQPNSYALIDKQAPCQHANIMWETSSNN
uniref:Uncharacterized protein n=1 Tax=Arundo donax TaxID=35708 RepID=A0A0A9C7X6_ARUDO